MTDIIIGLSLSRRMALRRNYESRIFDENWFCRKMAGAVFCSGGAAKRVSCGGQDKIGRLGRSWEMFDSSVWGEDSRF